MTSSNLVEYFWRYRLGNGNLGLPRSQSSRYLLTYNLEKFDRKRNRVVVTVAGTSFGPKVNWKHAEKTYTFSTGTPSPRHLHKCIFSIPLGHETRRLVWYSCRPQTMLFSPMGYRKTCRYSKGIDVSLVISPIYNHRLNTLTFSTVAFPHIPHQIFVRLSNYHKRLS